MHEGLTTLAGWAAIIEILFHRYDPVGTAARLGIARLNISKRPDQIAPGSTGSVAGQVSILHTRRTPDPVSPMLSGWHPARMSVAPIVRFKAANSGVSMTGSGGKRA